MLHHLQSVRIRQAMVAKDQVEALAFHDLLGGCATTGGPHLVTILRKETGKQIANVLVIIQDQYVC